ncbi:MAG: type II toxin-antitoxin system RelE/ParE family toxin [Herbiconiux sp.]|uniref:type II toxin-antitoxin system RelE family toxin n=1 Tax=Herbiconiux sp. TaxID=1871186 RepID=UPI001216AA22|nr:type II toxin-antitoxin system RelE/ParE family toxin [Herbiconiux sp.]TAJ49150.1 MAG: type II toxin-antitoxin system RelE/ParE family toxin [Herbiconiux sp.]
MNWAVRFAPAALRGLQRLPTRISPAIVEFATVTLPTNPERLSKPLRNELEGVRSARRGDYRVLFTLDDSTHTLLVVRVAHRADVYRL